MKTYTRLHFIREKIAGGWRESLFYTGMLLSPEYSRYAGEVLIEFRLLNMRVR